MSKRLRILMVLCGASVAATAPALRMQTGTAAADVAPSSATAVRGQKLVHASCETCHSLSPAQLKIGPSLFGALNGPQPRLTAAQAETIILHGKNKMPAFASVLTADDADSIVLFLKQVP